MNLQNPNAHKSIPTPFHFTERTLSSAENQKLKSKMQKSSGMSVSPSEESAKGAHTIKKMDIGCKFVHQVSLDDLLNI